METNQPRPRRGWLQFSLRSMLVFTTVLAVFLAVIVVNECRYLMRHWLEPRYYVAHEQREAVAALVALGGQVSYDYQTRGLAQPPAPTWLRKLAGNDFFQHVEGVWLDARNVTDSDLETLARLKHLRRLTLSSPKITDAGLDHLQGLTVLRELHLYCNVTDAGMFKLKPLTQLTTLECSRFPFKPSLEFRTDCEFTETPTRHALKYFAAKHGIPIQVDTAETAAVKLVHSSDITVTLKNVTLRNALETILHAGNLDWTGSSGGILVTTPEKAAENRQGLEGLKQSLPNLTNVSTDW